MVVTGLTLVPYGPGRQSIAIDKTISFTREEDVTHGSCML